MINSDEEILYGIYLEFARPDPNLPPKGKQKNDIERLKVLPGNIARVLVYMDEMNLDPTEVQNYVTKAKALYMSYAAIVKRRPQLVSEFLASKVDQLIRSICKHEAEMIKVLRMQDAGASKLNLEEILAPSNVKNRLAVALATSVIRDAIKDSTTYVNNEVETVFYITATGKKYHLTNCPYCKSKTLLQATEQMVVEQNLVPCKCVTAEKTRRDKIETCRTVFVDESIHKVAWNQDGVTGNVGSYSYIICKGDLKNEAEITEDNMITTGIEYCAENISTEQITKTAIGAVMLMLAYDYKFDGNVKIFTDNKGAMRTWKNDVKDIQIAKLFRSVTVQFVKRELNKKADQVGRTHICLKMPADTYTEVLSKNNMYTSYLDENERLKSSLIVSEDKISHLEQELAAERDRIKKLKKDNAMLQKRQSVIRIFIAKMKCWLQARSVQLATVYNR